MAQYLYLCAVLLLANFATPNGAPLDTHLEPTGSLGAPLGNLASSATVEDQQISDQTNTDDANMKTRGSSIGSGSDPKDPNSIGYSVSTSTSTKEGQCVREVTIKGNGVDDTISYPCSAEGMNSFTSDKDVLLTGPNTVQTNSIYGKQRGQLQLIREGKCSIRSYTIADGKTTVSSTPVEGAECDAMKKEHLERLQQWQKWQQETFPPGFPFHNKPGPIVPGFTSGTNPAHSQNPGNTGSFPFSGNVSPWAQSNPWSQGNLVGQGSPASQGNSAQSSYAQFIAGLMEMLNRLRGSFARRDELNNERV